jgi:predicted kinase
MECVIFVGLPAAGKTSFYRERFATTHDHVSKDLLRNNSRPDRRQQELIMKALAEGRSVVVDNTNATRAARSPLIAIAKAKGADVAAYYFPTDARDALRRNRSRLGRERVPDVAIFAVRKHLEPPSAEEGFDHLFVVRMNEDSRTFDVADLEEA